MPSTPTLSRRTDGFNEVVSSPHPQVPNARFTFTEARPSASSGSGDGAPPHQLIPEGIDDTRMDLSQLDATSGRSVPNTPQQTSPNEHERAVIHGSSNNEAEQAEQLAPSGSAVSVAGGQEEVVATVTAAADDEAGPSGSNLRASCEEGEGQVPEVTVSAAEDDEDDYGITTGAIPEDDQPGGSSEATAAGTTEKDTMDDDDVDDDDEEDDLDIDMEEERNQSGENAGTAGAGEEEESGDGVTSEGEKPGPSQTAPMEEGSEAEVLQTPSSNTRSRSVPRHGATANRRGRAFGKRGTGARSMTWTEGRSLNRSGPSVGQQQHAQHHYAHQRSPMGSPNRGYNTMSPQHQQQHSPYGGMGSPPMRRATRSTRQRARPYRQ